MAINSTTKTMLDKVLLWCGAYAIGDATIPTADENLALSEFVDMVRTWQFDSSLGYRVRDAISVALGDSTNEITSNPPLVVLAAYFESADEKYPQHIGAEAEWYNQLKTSVPGIPSFIWPEKSTTADKVVLHFNCPTVAAMTLNITSLKLMLKSELTGEVSDYLPSIYWDAFQLALRLRLDGFYENKSTDRDQLESERAKQSVRRYNRGAVPLLAPQNSLVL